MEIIMLETVNIIMKMKIKKILLIMKINMIQIIFSKTKNKIRYGMIKHRDI